MKSGDVRPVALCVIRKNDAILAVRGYDSQREKVFYRPPGGTIEFCEHSRQTIIREIREELSAELTNVSYVGLIEFIFMTDEGRQRHDLTIIYQADFENQSLYDTDSLHCSEGENCKAEWILLSDFQDGKYVLRPEGLLEILMENIK